MWDTPEYGMIITGVGQTEKEKLRRPIMNRKKKKRKMEGRATDGSGGHFCWSLGQQLLLEGSSTVMTGSTGKARGTKAPLNGGAVSCPTREGSLSCCHDFTAQKGPTRRASKVLAPIRKGDQHASQRGAWACGSYRER